MFRPGSSLHEVILQYTDARGAAGVRRHVRKRAVNAFRRSLRKKASLHNLKKK